MKTLGYIDGRRAFFDDTWPLSWGFGLDLGMNWDGTRFNVTQLTPDSEIRWGISGAGINQMWYSAEVGSYIYWDQSIWTLTLAGNTNLVVAGHVHLLGNLDVQGDVGIASSLTVIGPANFQGPVGINNSLTVIENLVVGGNIELSGSLRVVGTARFDNDITIMGSDASHAILWHQATDTLDLGLDDHGLNVNFRAEAASHGVFWVQDGDGNNGLWNFGADANGSDVYFYGATAGARVVWDQSINEMVWIGASSLKTLASVSVNFVGDVGIGGGLTVTGALNVLGGIGISGSLTVTENLVVGGNIECSGSLRIVLTARFDSDITIMGSSSTHAVFWHSASDLWAFGMDDHGINVSFYAEATGHGVFWDEDGDTDNGIWSFGATSKGSDVVFWGATADYRTWWDMNGDTNGHWYFGDDTKGVNVSFYAIVTGCGVFWDPDADTNHGTWSFGATGGSKGTDVFFYGATTGHLVHWNQDGDTNGQWDFGVSTKGIMVNFYGATANFITTFDPNDDTNGSWAFGANTYGIKVEFYAITTGCGVFWDPDADTNHGTWGFGATGGAKGVDVFFYGATDGSYTQWDQSADLLALVEARQTVSNTDPTAAMNGIYTTINAGGAVGWATGNVCGIRSYVVTTCTGQINDFTAGWFGLKYDTGFTALGTGLSCAINAEVVSVVNRAANAILVLQSVPGDAATDFSAMPYIYCGEVLTGGATGSSILLETNAVTTGAGGLYHQDTLQVKINGDARYIPLSTVEGAFTFNYATTILNTFTVGATNAGHDVIFWGAVTDYRTWWDANGDTNGHWYFGDDTKGVNVSFYAITTGCGAFWDPDADTNHGTWSFGATGGGKGTDVFFYGNTTGHYVHWNQDGDTNGQWDFGADTKGIMVTWYGDTTGHLVKFDPSGDTNGQWDFGASTKGVMVKFYGATASFITTFDPNDDTNGSWAFGADTYGMKVEFYAITTGCGVFWDPDADGSNGVWSFGAATGAKGVDVYFYGVTNGAYMQWDQSEDKLNIVGSRLAITNIVLGAAEIGLDTRVTVSAPNNQLGMSAYFQADINGTTAGHCYGFGSWINTGATSPVLSAGHVIVPIEGGVYTGEAQVNARIVFAGQHQAILNGAPASLHAWRLNTTQTIDALIAAANSGSVGYAASVGEASNKVGDLPLVDVTGHGVRYVRLYDAAG